MEMKLPSCDRSQGQGPQGLPWEPGTAQSSRLGSGWQGGGQVPLHQDVPQRFSSPSLRSRTVPDTVGLLS